MPKGYCLWNYVAWHKKDKQEKNGLLDQESQVAGESQEWTVRHSAFGLESLGNKKCLCRSQSYHFRTGRKPANDQIQPSDFTGGKNLTQKGWVISLMFHNKWIIWTLTCGVILFPPMFIQKLQNEAVSMPAAYYNLPTSTFNCEFILKWYS